VTADSVVGVGRTNWRWDVRSKQLADELRLLGASNVIVSTNIPTKSDGLPYADDRNIGDPGIAVYFDFKKKRLVMARDGFTRSPAISDR
jgi:hypothetical protein